MDQVVYQPFLDATEKIDQRFIFGPKSGMSVLEMLGEYKTDFPVDPLGRVTEAEPNTDCGNGKREIAVQTDNTEDLDDVLIHRPESPKLRRLLGNLLLNSSHLQSRIMDSIMQRKSLIDGYDGDGLVPASTTDDTSVDGASTAPSCEYKSAPTYNLKASIQDVAIFLDACRDRGRSEAIFSLYMDPLIDDVYHPPSSTSSDVPGPDAESPSSTR